MDGRRVYQSPNLRNRVPVAEPTGGRLYSPERALVAAIVGQAIFDNDAAWIESKAFDAACCLLDLEPTYMRKGIAALPPGRRRSFVGKILAM